jgi:hypothetical protein
MMAKLHELLAVGGNLDTQATQVLAELTATFDKKRHLFEEKITTFQSNEEGVPAVTESQSSIQSSVAAEIEWISGILSKSLDVSYQIDEANTKARADVVTEDGETILKDVPATTLLSLEKELAKVLHLAKNIPTLDPAKGFALDSDRPKGTYRAREVNKPRTKKINKPVVMHPPTKEHPAQVVMGSEDIVTGTIREQEWSSMITPALKADVIGRIEVLTRAVKKARAKANEAEVDQSTLKLGQKLLAYAFQPLKA